MACQYVVRHRLKTLEKDTSKPVYENCTHPSKPYKVGMVTLELCLCHRNAMKRSQKYKALLKRLYRRKQIPEFKWRPQHGTVSHVTPIRRDGDDGQRNQVLPG